MRSWVLLMMIGLIIVFTTSVAPAEGPLAAWFNLQAARADARAANSDAVAAMYASAPTVVAYAPATTWLPARAVRRTPAYVYQPLAAVSGVTVVPSAVWSTTAVIPYSMQTTTIMTGPAAVQSTFPRACTQAGPAPCTPAGPN